MSLRPTAARCRTWAIGAGAAAVILGTVAPALAQPTARAARNVSLNETAHLRLTSKHGFTLNEQGTAAGTIDGTIYIHLQIVSINHVNAEVSIYPHGGYLSGKASASYHNGGADASFSGSMGVSNGSGSYQHAHASNLSFSGTIARSNDAVTVHLSGQLST